MNKENLTHVGAEEGYMVYKNSDGFLEGYKTIGNSKYGVDTKGSDLRRVVTNQKTMEGFVKYVRGLNKKTKSKKLEFPTIPFID